MDGPATVYRVMGDRDMGDRDMVGTTGTTDTTATITVGITAVGTARGDHRPAGATGGIATPF